MDMENANIEYKSLRKVEGKSADLRSLAETCVCLANAQGGRIYVGIEDVDKAPPPGQRIEQELVNQVLSRLRSLMHSVGLGDANLGVKINTQSIDNQYFPFFFVKKKK